MEDLLQIVRSKKTSEQLAKSSGVNERRVAEILTGRSPPWLNFVHSPKHCVCSVTDLLEAAEDAERMQTLFRHGFYRQVGPRSEAEQQVVKVFSRVSNFLAPTSRQTGGLTLCRLSRSLTGAASSFSLVQSDVLRWKFHRPRSAPSGSNRRVARHSRNRWGRPRGWGIGRKERLATVICGSSQFRAKDAFHACP